MHRAPPSRPGSLLRPPHRHIVQRRLHSRRLLILRWLLILLRLLKVLRLLLIRARIRLPGLLLRPGRLPRRHFPGRRKARIPGPTPMPALRHEPLRRLIHGRPPLVRPSLTTPPYATTDRRMPPSARRLAGRRSGRALPRGPFTVRRAADRSGSPLRRPRVEGVPGRLVGARAGRCAADGSGSSLRGRGVEGVPGRLVGACAGRCVADRLWRSVRGRRMRGVPRGLAGGFAGRCVARGSVCGRGTGGVGGRFPGVVARGDFPAGGGASGFAER